MRTVLGKLVLAPVVLAAAALAASTAAAQATVNVPFSFTAAGKVMPAGTYVLDKDAMANIVMLRNIHSTETFQWLLGPGDPAPTDRNVTLRFDDLDGTHALRSIQFASLITSRLDRNSQFSEHLITSGK
jgi:hypothetical protein